MSDVIKRVAKGEGSMPLKGVPILSEETIDATLRQQREAAPLFLTATYDALRKIRSRDLNLAQLIGTLSYEAFPTDPLGREQVSGALVRLLQLIEEDHNSTIENVGTNWDQTNYPSDIEYHEFEPPAVA